MRQTEGDEGQTRFHNKNEIPNKNEIQKKF